MRSTKNRNGRSKIRNRLEETYGLSCVWCGKEFNSSRHMTIEHLVPREFKGTDELDNLRLACAECNHDRSTWYCYVLGKMRKGRVRFFSLRQKRYIKKDEFLAGF